MTLDPLISIIILNYNGKKFLENCIKSVLEQNYKKIEIILVDNDSSDNSHLECKEKFPKISLIENKENVGYCEGNNIGIRNAKGEFIVILNPDTEVKDSWLDELILAYNQNGDGLYQPKILSLYEKNVLQSTGNMIHLFGFGFARDKGVNDQNQFNKIEKIGYASGTCLFTSSKILRKIGLLDPFLFLYHDDLDLGWRAAQMGINSYFVPNAVIFHAESYSLKWSKKKFYWLERNRKYCLKTHYSKETLKKIKLSLWYTEILVWLFYISKGYVSAKIQAELDLRKNYKFIKKKQIEIENQKTISDLELIKEFPDRIEVPKDVSEGFHSKIFLNIIEYLSKKAKNKLINN